MLFIALIVGWLSVSATAHAADAPVDTIVVKYRDGALANPGSGLTSSEQSALYAALQTPFSHVGYTRDGALQLRLLNPLAIDAARAAINRARLLRQVLYANVVAPATGRVAPASSSSSPQPLVRRLIVKFRDASVTASAQRNETLARPRVDRVANLASQPVDHERAMSGGAFVLRMFQALPADQAKIVAAQIESDPDVEYAEPDLRMFPQLVPNDSRYAEQWDLRGPPTEPGGINIPAAWDITTGSAGIVVSVVDTGILPAHPDLSGRLATGYDFISDSADANDGGGRDADPTDAGDWVTSAESASGTFAGCPVSNSSFHGSHVAGTIGAASNNAAGVTGINWVSKILAARTLGKCGGSTSDIADAIRWSVGASVPGIPANPNPARVINMSLGGPGSCGSTFQNAINTALAANAVIVISAGNSAADAAGYSPGNCNGVITVAATGRNGQRASYSNFGSTVEIAAPGGADGVAILSLVNTSTTSPSLGSYDYGNKQGTSMAAPHVAGVASLLLSVDPTLTPSQVTSVIQTTARPFPTGTGRDCTTAACGAGLIDATAALQMASGLDLTTTTVTASPNPASVGASVTFTATVTGTNPTGTIRFEEAGTALSNCGVVALTGAGNTKSASCTTSGLGPGTHGITARYSGDSENAPSSGTVSEVITVAGSTNVALASTGAVASASSSYNSGFPASSINNNERSGAGGYWNDGTANVLPDSVQIVFNGSKTIDRVVVYSVQDNYASPVEPSDSQTFSLYGLTAFTVEAGSGSNWVPLASVSGNNLVKRSVSFPATTTDRIRITVNGTADQWSRITEVEAWTSGGSAPAPTSTTLGSAPNPANVGASVTFTATVSGTNPTGSVAFSESGNALSGCSAVALSGSGNSRSATCSTSSLAAGTHSIVASYSGDAGNAASSSPALSQVINTSGGGSSTNVALASAGAVASASSSHSSGFFPANSINNNERSGAGGYWNDGTANVLPDSVQIVFNGSKTIDRVVVYSVQDNYASPVEPSDSQTFSLYGLTAFTVEAGSGSNWVPLASVSGNNLVKRSVSFPATTTDRIRITVNGTADQWSRITEVEAWTSGGSAPAPTSTTLGSAPNPANVGASVTFTATVSGTNPTGSVAFSESGNALSGCSAVALSGSGNSRNATCSTSSLAAGTHGIVASYSGDAGNAASSSPALSQVINTSGGGSSTNVALASAGAVASASSSHSSGFFPANSINNNERSGAGGYWNDGTASVLPDSVQIVFNGSKTIDRVVVYSVQDNYASPVEPSDSQTFSLYGLTAFTVEAGSGSNWVPLASVSGNNLVKRSVSFPATTTDRIRITVNGTTDQWSRITEVEAWTSGGT